jgi:predicted nuclease of predicted toxin-antitoxin system
MDEHVPTAVSQGLRRRGVDVLTTQEAGLLSVSDEEHLKFAAEAGRIIFTQDADFLRLHAARFPHKGIIYAPQQTSISNIIRGLMLICDLYTPEDMVNHVEFL